VREEESEEEGSHWEQSHRDESHWKEIEEGPEDDGDEHMDVVEPDHSFKTNDKKRGQGVKLPEFSTLLTSLGEETYAPSDDYLAISRSSPVFSPYNWPSQPPPVATNSNYFSNMPVWQTFNAPSLECRHGNVYQPDAVWTDQAAAYTSTTSMVRQGHVIELEDEPNPWTE